MSELKISRVVAVSSEDPQFPATDLLTGGEWRCLGTEEEAWVLLLLEEPFFITDIPYISWGFRLDFMLEIENPSQRKWKFHLA